VTTELRARVLAWLDPRPAELAGLVVLLAGAAAATALVVRAQPTAGAGPTIVASPADDRAAALTVHVVGEVLAPGVVGLPADARVQDAIAAAGGPTVEARLEALNLARPLQDGEQLVVPGPSPAGDATTGADAGTGVLDDGRVDLNRASAAELETLPGIGPVLAQRIVSHREDHGPFSAPGDLRAVAGIGERTFQTLAELVVVR
jgi:competence protein ComEA